MTRSRTRADRSHTSPLRRRLGRRTFLTTCARIGAAAVLGRVVAAVPAFGAETPASARLSFPETRRSWYTMGTLMEIAIADLPRSEALYAIRRAKARVDHLEAVLTVFREQAPLPMFHRKPADRWVDVPVKLIETLQIAREGWMATDGSFDPSVGPLMRAWREQKTETGATAHGPDESWRRRPGLAALEIDHSNRRIRRLDARLELDLGGIGKGIAIDAALAEVGRSGSSAALINFGGSLGISGPPPERPAGWPVGIQHPRRPEQMYTVLNLKKGHLATSGDYERCVETQGVRRHHILDPKTGHSTRGVASVSVYAQTSTAADVESTATMVALARGDEVPTSHFLALKMSEGSSSLYAQGSLLLDLEADASQPG